MRIGKKYYLISLVLPIVVPVALIPFGINNILTALFLFSLVFGGVPYLIMCIFIIFWARKKNEVQLRKLSYVIPIIFILFMGIVYFIFF